MGGGGKGGSSTTVQKADPWKGIQPYLVGSEGSPGLYPEAAKLFSSDIPTYYPGQTYAPQTGLEQTAQAMRLGQVPAMQGVANQALGATAFGLGPALYAESNPYLQSYMKSAVTPLFEGLTEQVLPSVRGDFNMAGQPGSNRQAMVESQAIQDVMRQAGDITTRMASEGYGQGMNTMMQSLAFTPTAMSMGLAPSDVVSAVGQGQRAEQQLGIDEAMARWNFGQAKPYEKLSQYAQLLSGYPTAGFGTTSTSSPYSTSPLMGALGGAMTGYSALPMMANMMGLTSSAAMPAGMSAMFGGPMGAGLGAILGLLALK